MKTKWIGRGNVIRGRTKLKQRKNLRSDTERKNVNEQNIVASKTKWVTKFRFTTI